MKFLLAETLIGGQLKHARFRLTVALVMALALVGADFWERWLYGNTLRAYEARVVDYHPLLAASLRNEQGSYQPALDAYATALGYYNTAKAAHHRLNLAEGCLALIAVLACLILARGDPQSAGLLLAPVQGWRYWVVAGIKLGLCVVAVACPLALAWWFLGWPLDGIRSAEIDFNEACTENLIRAPLYEECIYRVAVCVPLVAAMGPRGAIIGSGVLFGLVHVVGGNPNPANLIAGFFFAWAFLKSNTILVPMAFHAVGNLVHLAARWTMVNMS